MADNNDNPLGISSATTETGQLFGFSSRVRPKTESDKLFESVKRNPAEEVVEVSRDTNPDEEAKIRDTASRLSVRPETVAAAPDEANRQLQRRETHKLLRDSQITSEFLRDPINARIAHDSVKDLSFMEGVGNSLVRGWLGVKQTYQQYQAEDEFRYIQDAASSYTEILESERRDSPSPAIGMSGHLSAMWRYVSSRVFDPDQDAYLAHQRRVGELVKDRSLLEMSEGTKEFMESVEDAEGFFPTLAAIASNPKGVSTFSAEVGLEFLPQLLAAGAVTLGTRNPQLGAIALGIASGGTERYRSPQDFLMAAGIDFTDPAQVDALLMNPELMKQAQEFGFSRGAIIGGLDMLSGGIAGKALAKSPIVDLLLQTAVQSSFGGAGEALAQLETTGKVNVNDVIFEALGELATTPLDVALIGGRPLLARVKDAHDSAKAENVVEGMDQLAEAAQNSPLTERSPDTAAKHLGAVLTQNGVETVFVSSSVLNELDKGRDESLIDAMGVRDQVAEADQYGGDVRITAEQFSRYVLQDPQVYAAVKDHVRMDADALTAAEAREIDEEIQAEITSSAERVSAEEVVSRDTDPTAVEPSSSIEVERASELAEHEAGVAALFSTAKEAGFTESQYASYVEAVQNMRSQLRKRAEAAELKREKRRLSKQYAEARENMRQEVQESVSQRPLYNAMQAIGVDRLSFESVLRAFQGDRDAMRRLPKNNGRVLYAPEGQAGLDADMFADLHGFPNGDVLLHSLVDQPTYEQAVEAEITSRVERDNPTLISTRQTVEEALQALHSDSQHGTVLTFELARLRQMRSKKKISRSLIVAKAKRLLANYRVGEMSPARFETLQRREARKSRKALREGDLDAAAEHKLNQVVAHEMGRETYRIQREVAAGNKKMRKLQATKQRKRGKVGGIPIEYREQAQAVLSAFQFEKNRSRASGVLQRALDEPPVPEERPGESLKQWAARKKEDEGIVVHLGPTVEEADGRVNWKNLTLTEWREVRDAVDNIVLAGQIENKLRSTVEGLGVDQIVSEIAEGIEANLKPRKTRKAKDVKQVTKVRAIETMASNVMEAFQDFGINLSHAILNADSVLRAIDGFKSIGPAYRFLKGGLDRAHSTGYLEGQVGYARRMRAESKALTALYEKLSPETQKGLWREVDIPGVRQRLTGHQKIGVLLNMGNAENVRALTTPPEKGKPGQFTEAELRAIVNVATKEEMDFVQAAWDYLSTFAPEVKESVRRRQNRDPVMVEALALETPHGTYKGGYFPLHYDTEKAVVNRDATGAFDFEEARDHMLRGGFVVGHTRDGHTQTRAGSGGRPVRLDPFILTHHAHQVVYDLEMGDAVHDAFKVLHNAKMRQAFSDAGLPQVWQALDLWLGDVITGEVHRGGFWESSLRHIRTGTTISKLAWNFTTAMLQPLGLMQTSVQIGKANTIMGLFDLVGGRGQNPMDVYRWVTEQSGFMEERETSFNKDIRDAQRALKNGVMSRVLPGKTHQYVTASLFLFIAKAQRFVDVVTYLGARRQGLEMFPDDPAKVAQHAERMVARAQGSGVFQERTGFERGTVNSAVRNTEMVRVWSLFLSYFAAKMNVFYERSKKVDIRNNPMDVINYPVDIAMLFFVEGMAAGLIREGLNQDDDDNVEELLGLAAREGLVGFTAGIPLVREVTSAVQGFDTGGAVGGFAGAIARAGVQISQGEADVAAAKAINNVAGILFKYPTSQVNKTGQAIYEGASPWNDVEWWEYLTGVRRKED